MLVKLKDGKQVNLEKGATLRDLAQQLHLTAPDQGLGASVNGKSYDLDRELKDQDEVHFWNFDDKAGKEIFWHTSAHVLAQAVLRLWPEAKPTIGPPIDNGFYYDFADLTISDEDFPKIEKEMESIIQENLRTSREEFDTVEEAIEAFKNNPYKIDLIKSFDEGVELSAYRQGEFFDLCRGPHMPNLNKIKAIKVLKTAGAYWRGDSKNPMLTRIYAITFPDRKRLKEYLTMIEEAKKRDHKVLGPRLGLFSLKEEAPGMPFIHPHGMIIWNKLLDYWRDLHSKAGYIEIKTPVMMGKDLWERSGHWQNYRHNMFTSSIEERDFAIKPMNCPGCMLYYASSTHSYRDLPLAIAEIGNVHRFEASGAISGLFRVRSFHQDDAHIFMKPEDITPTIIEVIKLADTIYSAFGLTYHLELSTRPKEGTIGTDEEWELATLGLREALEAWGKPYKVNEGDGAFYGPKIDFHIKDALSRTWQCGTIQLDMALPDRFELEYTAADGSRKRPIMVHRALFGSIERFFGILIEHYAGRFPLWISPRQIRILTVADRHADFAHEVNKRFKAAGFLSTVDDSNESVGKKVRNAQLDQVNYILTIGDKELENRTVALRTRNNIVKGEVAFDELLKVLNEELKNKLNESPFSE